MKKYYIIMALFLVNISMGSINIQNQMLSNEKYITGEDGVIRMYINIIGHVKNPGIYLVYDGIDYMSVLSAAGGYLEGSDLKNVIIFSEDGDKRIINLDMSYSSNAITDDNIIQLKPHDTLYIKQKLGSKILTSSNLPGLFLSFLNILLTLDRAE